MRIVIGLVVLLAFIWTEWTGVSGIFVGSTRGAVVQSALATRTVKDPEHDVVDRQFLDVKIEYAVKGQTFAITRQWSEQFWNSNGRLRELAEELGQGKSVDVLYLRFAPGVARPDVQVPLGIVILVVVGLAILIAFFAGAKALRSGKGVR